MSRLPFVPQASRATRVTFHLLRGLATTAVVFPFVAPTRKRTLIKRWSARLLRMLNVEVQVHGAFDSGGGNLLIVANHVSWLDIFVLNARQPLRFVAKSELARWPVAGRLIRGAGTIFVDRARLRDTRRVNHHAAEALARGDIVAVFPEGATTDGTTLLRFHASLLQPIVESQGRLLPVAIRYRDVRGAPSTAPTYGDESFGASFWRVCGERRLIAEIIVTSPIPARQLHRRELALQAESAIRTALELPSAATAPGTRDVREGSPQ